LPGEGGGGGGGGTYGTRTCLGGEEDREWSECSRCWICKGSPWSSRKLEGLEAGSWKDWKLEGTEGHRCGDALGPEDLGIVSLKLRKSGNFFFRF
jgi:hypothetical protein